MELIDTNRLRNRYKSSVRTLIKIFQDLEIYKTSQNPEEKKIKRF
jgi:hypothetical protein